MTLPKSDHYRCSLMFLIKCDKVTLMVLKKWIDTAKLLNYEFCMIAKK